MYFENVQNLFKYVGFICLFLSFCAKLQLCQNYHELHFIAGKTKTQRGSYHNNETKLTSRSTNMHILNSLQ